MRKTRKLPFGYCIRTGQITIVEHEAKYVKDIFAWYEGGASINTIAFRLTKQGVPYAENDPVWNKHKVKRTLENNRYTGIDGFPCIVDPADYKRVRNIYEERTKAYQTRNTKEGSCLWSRIYCAECESPMYRIRGTTDSTLKLRCSCDKCWHTATLDRNAFMSELSKTICSTANSEIENAESEKRIVRLNNEISAMTEQASDMPGAIRLILEAAAERYAACPKLPDENAGMDWTAFKNTVDRILVMDTGEIDIQFK